MFGDGCTIPVLPDDVPLPVPVPGSGKKYEAGGRIVNSCIKLII